MSANKTSGGRGVTGKVKRGIAKGLVSILKAPEVQTELWEIMHRPARRHGAQDIQSELYRQATEETAAYVKEHMLGATCFDSRFELLEAALQQAKVQGLYLEFGVFNGRSINFIAQHVPGQTVHGFDSLEGLPEDWFPGRGKGEFSMHGELPGVQANVQLHVGWFDQTLPKFAEDHAGPIAFMNIDCDIYASTKVIFDVLGDRVVPGTVIRFDEYFNYPGWQEHEYKAFQEFVEARKLAYRYIGYSRRDYSVAVIIGDSHVISGGGISDAAPRPTSPRRKIGRVREFQLDAVRVGKKHGVVARHVIVFRRRVENVDASLLQMLIKVIDLLAAVGDQRQMMQSGRIHVVLFVGRLGPDAERAARPRPDNERIPASRDVLRAGIVVHFLSLRVA